MFEERDWKWYDIVFMALISAALTALIALIIFAIKNPI